MNISKNTAGKCEKKCEYSFQYPTTNLIARNKGEYISYRPGPQREPPVMYNADKYNVKEMRLYQPALHSFGGDKPDAELIIEHVNTTGSGKLAVCIPVKKTSSDQTTTLDELVVRVAKFAPTKGGNAGEISLPFFSFTYFVPTKPYYSYRGNMPGSNEEYDFIIFDKENAVPISELGHRSLLKLIQKNNHNLLGRKEGFTSNQKDSKVYFNEKGAKKTVGGLNGDDDIYIECQPTGDSGEILIDTPVTSSRAMFSGDAAKNILDSKFFQIGGGTLLGILIMFILFKAFNLAASYLKPKTSAPAATPPAATQP